MEPLLDSATGAPRRFLEDLHSSAPEDTEGPEVGDASMLSSHTSAATESTAHESSVASSYRFPAHEGMFSGDYTPFSFQGLQHKHSEEMATAGKDQSCDVKRNDSHGTHCCSAVSKITHFNWSHEHSFGTADSHMPHCWKPCENLPF